MKKLITLLFLMAGLILAAQPQPIPNGIRTPFILPTSGGGLGINNQLPKAALDVKSTTNGILIPRMTTSEKNAIALPNLSEFLFDLTLGVFQYYNGTTWVDLSAGGSIPTAQQVFTVGNTLTAIPILFRGTSDPTFKCDINNARGLWYNDDGSQNEINPNGMVVNHDGGLLKLNDLAETKSFEYDVSSGELNIIYPDTYFKVEESGMSFNKNSNGYESDYFPEGFTVHHDFESTGTLRDTYVDQLGIYSIDASTALANQRFVKLATDSGLSIKTWTNTAGTVTFNTNNCTQDYDIDYPNKPNGHYVPAFIDDIPVTSVNTQTGAVVLTQDNVGDGTTYKQYSATEKTKLAGIATGANVGVVPNGTITGATKTKITYDAKGLVTTGADATTADIADSTNKRYQTDNQNTRNDATSSIQGQLNGKEPVISAGTTSQYWRGDKSWQSFPFIPDTATDLNALSRSGDNASQDINIGSYSLTAGSIYSGGDIASIGDSPKHASLKPNAGLNINTNGTSEVFFKGDYVDSGTSELAIQAPAGRANGDYTPIFSINDNLGDSTGNISVPLPIKVFYSTTGTATTTFTVTIGVTMTDTSYVVSYPMAENLLSSVNWRVSNKTTTTFDVITATGLTGSVAFECTVTP